MVLRRFRPLLIATLAPVGCAGSGVRLVASDSVWLRLAGIGLVALGVTLTTLYVFYCRRPVGEVLLPVEPYPEGTVSRKVQRLIDGE